MKLIGALLLLLASCTWGQVGIGGPAKVAGSSALGAPLLTSFAGNYLGSASGVSATCGTAYGYQGFMPSGAGPFPVLVMVPATTESYLDLLCTGIVRYAAYRGFLAVTMDYANATDLGCTALTNKGNCIFGSGASSIVTQICAMPQASCTGKGLVVIGYSQGSQIAIMAQNWYAGVKAVYAISTGNYTPAGTTDFSACMNYGNYTQSPANIRAISGDADNVFTGGPNTTTAGQLNAILNLACSTTIGPSNYSCAQGGGTFTDASAGWAEVLDADLCSGGTARHTYITDSCWPPPHPSGLDGSTYWPLVTNLNWLRQFVTHYVTLSWTASTPGTYAIAGYNVYRSSDAGATYTKLTPSPVSALSFDDVTVLAGSTYYYVATAVDVQNNESAQSAPGIITIPR